MARGTRADATRHARPHGRAARAFCEAQVAHRAWIRGGATRVHADARVGRHVVRGGSANGGSTG